MSTPSPTASARRAGLHYTTNFKDAITRTKTGTAFTYFYHDDKITDTATIERINSLAIPPAYRDVRISPYEDSHIQATGIDERGRKQYRYHPHWREIRDETKYHRMLDFGKALGKIRTQTEHDMHKQGLPKEKVLATIVQLLEKTTIRVGNEQYAKQNKSYGLTTLEPRHLDVEGSVVHFKFRGKSGKYHEIDLRDKRIATIVKKLQDLPGQELFEFVDSDGTVHNLTSADVNHYLKEIAGDDFTAKDFRTWTGTVLASLALQEFDDFDSQTQAKRNVTAAIKRVAERLGNTPAICRKCYVNPTVIESYLDKSLASSLRQEAEHELSEELAGLEPEEAAVLAFLEKKLGR